MKNTYKNRYGDIFAFELQEDGNILWSGNFKYCRFGMPNDYTRAYKEYVDDNCNSDHCMSLKQFKEEVHRYDDETHQYIYDKYVRMVDCLRDKIDMIDPSGGPYITVGMNMKRFGFENSIVKDFEVHKDGYLIITEK
jgi:hypothetical protein